jgi:hypothetical protein
MPLRERQAAANQGRQQLVLVARSAPLSDKPLSSNGATFIKEILA